MPILEVPAVLARLVSLPVETYAKGAVVLAEGAATGKLLVMTTGAVEVIKGGVRIAEIREPGAVLGEVSVLLDKPHGALVRALEPSTFHVADGRTILRVDPIAALYVAMALAERLDAVNRYLVEARRQIEQADEPRSAFRDTLDTIGRSLQYGPPL